ncbi:MAG TPA: PH domain-containing protein [Blastocatellia bacterium]|nr:PH domain-containing protein [Blastocatellia bacterium]
MAPPQAPRVASPPPRPARRAPVIPSIPDRESFEEYEEDYPERYEDDYREDVSDLDEEIFSVNPTIFEVVPGYLLAIALSLIATAVVALVDGKFLFAVIAAAIFFIMPILRHIRLKHTVYTLTTAKVEIRTGMLSKSAQSIPLHHIDNVEVSETLKERMIGIGDVLIDSAALDSKMVMNNIRSPRKYADMILYQLRNKH